MDDDTWEGRLRAMRSCARILSGALPPTAREQLTRTAALADDADCDVYGEGGAVARLEERTASLLGTEDALLFPTGTMAQQAALRTWASRTGSDRVAMHPRAHPLVHESDTLRLLSGLRPLMVCSGPGQITAADVRDHPEPFGTLFVEIPQADHGFTLPGWNDLNALAEAARERDAVLHLDGARLWESTRGLGRTLPEITALFDTVYVSYYKALGALSGAALAGPADILDEARVWRHRYGGQVFQQWPTALTALAALEDTLPRLPRRVEHAAVVAGALASVPGAVVHPRIPHTHQFHVHLPYPASLLNRLTFDIAREQGVWLVPGWHEPGVPGHARAAVTVAEPALEWTGEEIADAFGAYAERARAEAGAPHG